MGFFGGKSKGVVKHGGAASSTAVQPPPATRRSVRRVVPSAGKTTSRSARPGVQAARPATAPVSNPHANELAVEDVQLPPQVAELESEGLDLNPGATPIDDPTPTPTRPPFTRPILASAAPAFSGGISDLGSARRGPTRTGDQDLLQFLTGKVGLLDEAKAVSVRVRAEKDGISVDEAAVLLGMITEEQLVNALSQETWVPHLKVDKYEIRKKALDTVTREDAVHFGVFPVDKLGSLLTLAMVNPLDAETIRALEQRTGLDIKKVVATRGEINQAIDRYYGGKVAASEGSRSFTQEVADAPRSSTQMLGQAAPKVVEEVVAPLSLDEPVLATPASIHPDFSADIQDIDDLLGAEDAIAPAIIEPVSIRPEESSDALELTDAAIAPGSNDEFALADAPGNEASALDKSMLEAVSHDGPKPEEPKLPVASAPAPAPRRQGGERSATAKFTAGGGVAGKVINLVPVLEDEFRYAINHGKGKIFERWVALQTRNRIVNAVSVEKDLDHLLAGLYATPRKAG